MAVKIEDVKIFPISATHSSVTVYTAKRAYETSWADTPTREEVEAGFREDKESGKLRNWKRII